MTQRVEPLRRPFNHRLLLRVVGNHAEQNVFHPMLNAPMASLVHLGGTAAMNSP